MIIQHFNYSVFQERFFSRVQSAALFNGRRFNYIKLVIENLVVQYAKKGKIREYVFFWFPGLFILVKRLVFSFARPGVMKETESLLRKGRERSPRFVLIDNGRVVKASDGRSVSVYFHRLRQFLQHQNIPFIHYLENVRELCYGDEFTDKGLRDCLASGKLSGEEREILSDLKAVYGNLKKSGSFSEEEQAHMRGGMTVFFSTFRIWNAYLRNWKPSAIIILGHYHREGIILAARLNGVKVIELQHGLIAEEDIFYHMPQVVGEVRDKALFPDIMFTYGQHWKNILLGGHEFSPSQVRVMGYYLYEDKGCTPQEKVILDDFCKDLPVLLITTQPSLHKDFVSYIRSYLDHLKNRGQRVKILLKLHPADKDEWFDELKNVEDVLVTRIRLEVLFQYCRAQLTGYSTTIYDAFRYGVTNYAVSFPDAVNYVRPIVSKGFAMGLEVNEFPDLSSGKGQISAVVRPEDLFASSDFNLLLHA